MIGEEGIRERRAPAGQSDGLSKTPSIKKTIRNMDIFNKRSFQAVEKTTFGGAISFIIVVCILILCFSELLNFLKVRRQDTLGVDDRISDEMQIFFNITFPHVQCGDLHVDIVDASGEAEIDIAASITKQPFDREGNIIPMGQGDEINKFDNKAYFSEDDPHSPDYCGHCYTGTSERSRRKRGDKRKKKKDDRSKRMNLKMKGIEEEVRDGRTCCNSCEQVIEQLQKLGRAIPPKTEIKQCIHEISRVNPGCNMYGVLGVNRVTGNFHFAPGVSYTEYRGHFARHIHELDPVLCRSWNASHIIHELRFGAHSEEVENPRLRDMEKIFGGVTVHKYFLKVVPTFIEGKDSIIDIFKSKKDGGFNQVAMTEHVHEYDDDEFLQMPGVFFVYDFSPIKVTYSYYRYPFTHFLVKLCAVVGGILAVSKFADKLLENTLDNFMSKKFD